MTSSNENIFRVTGPLCGEFTGPGEFHAKRPVMRSFDVFFDLHLNKWLSKQWYGEAGELRRYRDHYDVIVMVRDWAPGSPEDYFMHSPNDRYLNIIQAQTCF